MTVAHATGCFPPLLFSNGTSTSLKNLGMSVCLGDGGLGPHLWPPGSSIPARWLVWVEARNPVLAHRSFGKGFPLREDPARCGPHSSSLTGPGEHQWSQEGWRSTKTEGAVPLPGMIEPSSLGVSCCVKVGSGFSLPFRWRRWADSSSFRSQLASLGISTALDCTLREGRNGLLFTAVSLGTSPGPGDW